MGLLTKVLIASAIKGAVAISENVAEVAIAKSNERAAEANARASYNTMPSAYEVTQTVNKNVSQSRVSPYDIDLFYAKVAMISYIATADNKISRAEEKEIDQLVSVASNMFGDEIAERAMSILEDEGGSFIALEPYLRKIQERDLDSFLFYADEFAKTDNMYTVEEEAAIKKLHSYIESRKGKKEYHDLVCSSCGGHMRSDQYGYKAVCECCGLETIMNVDNSPLKAVVPSTCGSCGRSLTRFENSKVFKFCPYCGGDVYASGSSNSVSRSVPLYSQMNTRGKNSQKSNEPNLYISYNTINPSVGMVTRIVSTGVKNSYVNGQTLSFHLPQGAQAIILKIGMKNYRRDVVIPPSNAPVRIYASFNGRAQISVDQPPC